MTVQLVPSRERVPKFLGQGRQAHHRPAEGARDAHPQQVREQGASMLWDSVTLGDDGGHFAKIARPPFGYRSADRTRSGIQLSRSQNFDPTTWDRNCETAGPSPRLKQSSFWRTLCSSSLDCPWTRAVPVCAWKFWCANGRAFAAAGSACFLTFTSLPDS